MGCGETKGASRTNESLLATSDLNILEDMVSLSKRYEYHVLTYQGAEARPDAISTWCTLSVGKWAGGNIGFTTEDDLMVGSQVHCHLMYFGIRCRCDNGIRCCGRAERSTSADDLVP